MTNSDPTTANASTTSAASVRQQFVSFFADKHGHQHVPSSPVVPHSDPTLLFTNAGMNQFKPYFLGTEQPPKPPRVANSQKCIRAGGKHNDLDDVGKDTYHHTFFEMLGNWSFGDYFKTEAIDWAWELLTKVWGLDPDRLHATYFEGDPAEGLEPDMEARELWLKYLPADRVHPGNKKDNFWEMGDTGPCGPCSEIHYDRTPNKDGGKLVNADSPDVIEIWNLVFIQFNRSTDGKLSPLPAKHVDTGMGFERICAVLQGAQSNYDTDVFTPLFQAIQSVTGARAYEPGGSGEQLTDPINVAYRVIADHIRCLTFALSDGAHCGNTGRDSVLRTILRRAVRFGHQQLGMGEPFLYKLVPAVVKHMGDAFPEIRKTPDAVAAEIKEEEESFRKTLERGIGNFEAECAKLIARAIPGRVYQTGPGATLSADDGRVYHADSRIRGKRIRPDGSSEKYSIGSDIESQREAIDKYSLDGLAIHGDTAFDLEATYGFPISLTQVMAEERGLTVDMAGYEQAKARHAEISRGQQASGDITASLVEIVQQHDLPDTTFLGYELADIDGTKDDQYTSKRWLFAVGPDGVKPVDKAASGDRVALVTEQTVFYGESGGQVGDTGTIACQCGAAMQVDDTQKIGNVTFHLGTVTDGTFVARLDDARPIIMHVDSARRDKIKANHTGTHLLNRALRDCVNKDTAQKGSLVEPDRLRFDFANSSAVADEQIEQVEQTVNDDIAADLPVYAQVAPQDAALKINGLRAVFGEKYPPNVRVVSIGASVDDLLAEPGRDAWAKLSIEFCGGTHLARTGDAEGFVIVSEEAVSKGVRRITALTGSAAHRADAEADMLLNRVEQLADAPVDRLADQIEQISTAAGEATLPLVKRRRIQAAVGELNDKLKAAKKQQGNEAAAQVAGQAAQLAADAEGPIIVCEIPGADGKTLRSAMDAFRGNHPDAAILLGAASDGKVALMATCTNDNIAAGLKAGDWIKHVAPIVGGGGGGRPDSAQAGGKNPDKLADALEAAKVFAESKA